jgi:hypothetical protein
MIEYRIYLLDGGGRIVKGFDETCESDDEAIEAARGMLPAGGEAEVWQGTRCLGRVSRAGAQPSSSDAHAAE